MSVSKTLIRKNAYFDSVTLMRISGQAKKLAGVEDVLVGMGTELNKELLQKMGLLSDEMDESAPNDLMIGISCESEAALENALQEIEKLFGAKQAQKADAAAGKRLYTIEQAAEEGDFNMAVISVPGRYAKREAVKALKNDMNVLLFSDNVSVEEEIELKDLAIERNLLMMGPDCGTAIINGIPLAFANRVRRGNIGIVGASGTGLQHVTTLIDAMGGGITQAIGTGGRDLSAKVQGRTALLALDALKNDEATEVVVLISKPPAPEVAENVFKKAANLGKPVVLCLLGAAAIAGLPANVTQCFNIEETAAKAVELATQNVAHIGDKFGSQQVVQAFAAKRQPEQKYVRGIFGGGTLCDEAMTVFRRANVPMFSNIPLDKKETLADVEKSQGNTFIDMGEDYFTNGKPHPMLEPGLRHDRIVQDAIDPQTAVILLDVVLGHGSHGDPAGLAVAAATEAKAILRREGREVLWIAALVGTENDPQGYMEQAAKLTAAGFAVFESNVRAAQTAAKIYAEYAGGVQ